MKFTPGAAPATPESEPPFVIVPPASESLLDLANPESPWPEEIRTNPALQEQAAARVALRRALDATFEAVPVEMTLEEASARGLVDNRQLASLYGSLADLLADAENGRATLYLPFEVLPSSGWGTADKPLAEALDRFKLAYLDRWWEAISVADLRASFSGGDVPDDPNRAPASAWVVKAAHIAPQLVEKGLLSGREVLGLVDDNPGTTLAVSLVEAMPEILARDGFDPAERRRAEALVAAAAPLSSAPEPRATPARQKWLAREAEARSREAEAESLSARVGSGDVKLGELAAAAGGRGAAIAVAAVALAAERVAAESPERAREIVDTYAPVLGALAGAEPEAADALAGAWSRLQALGVASGQQVGSYAVPEPKLDASFAETLPGVEGELASVEAALAAAAADARLANVVAPVANVVGSRLKGYGLSTSDLDVSVFVQPETSRAESPAISAALAENFEARGVDAPIQFWLEAEGDQLLVGKPVDLGSTNPNMASALFGGAWVGNREAIKYIHARLLSGYLQSNDSRERRRWLGDMERSALLFRLAHRGYRRFFPPQGSAPAAAPALDPGSAFWDSGYRRLATKLYASRVFLPKLGKE